MRVSSAVLVCVALSLSLVMTTVEACDGAPYLYLTFHGGDSGISNVMKYTLDGCPVGSSSGVLQSSDSFNPEELRTLALASDGTLLVTNAYKGDYVVAQYSQCVNANGDRNFIDVFAANKKKSSKGLKHPYGIAINPATGDVYVSNQHADNVLRFYGLTSSDSGEPMPSPSSIDDPPYPGTFAQFSTSSKGIRSIAFNCNGSALFAAQEDDNSVYVLDVDSGDTITTLKISVPISLYSDCVSNRLYIGSHDSTTPQVLAYDMSSLQQVSSFSNPQLVHPAGLVVYQDRLYVLGHDEKALISFEVSNSTFNGVVVSGLSDNPEQIMLSPC